MEPITIVSVLLDESGSMASIKDDTIGGFNHYLTSLQDPRAGAVLFSLVKFDSNAITTVYKGVPVADAVPLTNDTYRPGASTPLIDAAYKTIVATADVVAQRQDTPHVLIVIQTDGQENASTEHTNAELHQLIKEKSAAGWGFIFLGAGIDAFTQAGKWGIQTGSTLNYSRGKSVETFVALTSNTAHFRASGDPISLSFTPEQRKSVSDDDMPPVAPTLVAPSISLKTNPRAIVDDFSLVPDAKE
jgi:hypothetical protein